MSRLLLISLCILIVAGCAQKKIIDDLALINAIGYDFSDDKENPLKVTSTFPIITKDRQYDRKTITVTAKSGKETREKTKYQTNLQLESGQLRVAVFGTEVAKQGLYPILSTLIRDPTIGTRVKMALGKNGASEILNLQIENEGQNATYLEQFISKMNIESRRINYNFFQFLRDYFDDGIDPILPIFKVENKNIGFDGMGLFQEDRLIEILNPLQSQLLFLMRKDIQHGILVHEIVLESEKKESIILMYEQTDYRIKVNSPSTDQRTATIYVELLGDVLEYTGEADFSDPKIGAKMEKLIGDYVNKRGSELILNFQKLQVDPLGIGQYIRNKMEYRDWKNLNWRDAYPNMNVEIQAVVKINSSGKWK